jgi:hypothetical protein
VPANTRWIPARYYRYPYILDQPDRLMLNPSGNLGGTQLFDFPPNKFLVCVKTSHADHPVYSAMMRCLCGWWIASQFGLEWFMTYSQLYGIPQRIAYYEPGDDTVFQRLTSMMRNSGAATWGVYPRNTEVTIQSAAGGGGHMPQERLIEQADRSCDILLLGQTLTTDVHESGSRALGTVHKTVWGETKEAAAQYVANIISTQLVPGIVQYNFGELSELPVLTPIIDAPVDLFATAQAMKIIAGDMKLPVALRDMYDLFELSQPEPDEDLYEPVAPPAAPAPASPNGLFTHPGITTPEGQGKNREYGDGAPAGVNPSDKGLAASHASCGHSKVAAQQDENDQDGQDQGDQNRDDLVRALLLALLFLYGRGKVNQTMLRQRTDTLTISQLRVLSAKVQQLAQSSMAGTVLTPEQLPNLDELLTPAPAKAFEPQRSVEEGVQSESMARFYERNAQLIKGVHWHSVIDDRTTPQCRQLHDKEWSYPDLEPIGHEIPWPGFPPIWYNCRSTTTPILITRDKDVSDEGSSD